MSANELGKQAYQKMILNEHNLAIGILNSAIAKHPTDKRLYANRCYSHLQLRDFRSAMKDANHLTSHFQTYLKGYLLKGEILLGMKDFEMAEKCFSRAIELFDCDEIKEKLYVAQIQQIYQKGYDVDVARKALRISCTVQEALRSLALGLIKKCDDDQKVYNALKLSEEEDRFLRTALRHIS